MTLRRSAAVALTCACVALSTLTVRADVRADEKSRFEFAGMLGKFVNFFGGKAAREGVTSSVAVKGNRLARMSENDGQIIDLSEEKVYHLDLKKKSYTVVTFAEMRRQMEEAQRKAREEAAKSEGKAAEKPAEQTQKEPQVEIDFDLKSTGQQRTINGYDTKQQIATITVREKGKTLDESGGMLLTVDSWIAPRIAAMKEVSDFYLRYAQKIYGSALVPGADAQQMASIMAMYPMMKQAIAKMNAEGERVQGTPILTTMTFEGVKSQEQMAAEAKQSEPESKSKTPTSVGGLLGGFARKAAAKKASGGDDGPKQRATIMTGTTEVLKVVTDVSAADVAVPTGFKESR